jgi:hypothetical protein
MLKKNKKNGKKYEKFGMAVAMSKVWHGEWQWLGGSGYNRFARSARFEWC